MYDVVQIAGSLMILAGFVGSLGGRLEQTGYACLAGNAIGSTALTATAMLVSLYSILRKGLRQAVST